MTWPRIREMRKLETNDTSKIKAHIASLKYSLWLSFDKASSKAIWDGNGKEEKKNYAREK